MKSHDSCTNRSSRVLIVASLQRMKLEARIPAPADCEVRSVIKFFNAQSIAPFEIHCQLCQVYGHTRIDGQHFSSRSSAARYLIFIHPIARTSRPVISIFSYTSRNSCPVRVSVFENDREAEVSVTVVPIQGGRLLRHRDTKFGPIYDISQFRGEYVEKKGS